LHGIDPELSCDSVHRDAISGETVRRTGIHHLMSRTNMRKQPDSRLLGNFAVRGGLIALGMLITGCSAPNPNTAAGQSEIAGQKCAVCRAQNPGDIGACYAICMQRIEDQGAYLKSTGH
jgi:hypothetical protein